jgi:branched-chain amino acid transport system ATP-binding protein
VARVLELRGVSKRFGGLEALRSVSLDLSREGIYGLIGPNGAGKTTLFNVVTGVARATSGTVHFAGQPITDLPPHRIARLGVARTYQLVRPFFELTALENVQVGMTYGRRPGARAPAGPDEAREYLGLVGLADRAWHAAEALNLGERKRLEIARALGAEPRLLLLDEVLAGLNPTEVGAAVELLRRIHRAGITILMIEHNMQAIMAACSHIFVLHHGELIAEGPPGHVSRDPGVVRAYLGDRQVRLERRRGQPLRA